jgi:hypothetical protein
MKSKLFAFLLPAACGAALAFRLSVAAAEQPLGPALTTPPATPATSDAPAAAATSPQQYTEYRNDQWHFARRFTTRSPQQPPPKIHALSLGHKGVLDIP